MGSVGEAVTLGGDSKGCELSATLAMKAAYQGAAMLIIGHSDAESQPSDERSEHCYFDAKGLCVTSHEDRETDIAPAHIL